MAFINLVGTYITTGQLISGIYLMTTKNQQGNIDPQKIRAERLNCRFALLGVIALLGDYKSTGQIIPGIV